MNSKLTVESYVPESELLRGKHRPAARLCRERCAVVLPSRNWQILAARGEDLHEGEDFRTAAKLTSDEREALLHTAPATRSLQTANGAPMLVFADWLTRLGLLLVVLPACGTNAARYALGTMNRRDVSFERPMRKSSAKECREAYEILSEVLNYLDVLLDPHFSSVTDSHVLLRIAAFAGCRIDGETRYSISQSPPTVRSPRTVAFLLCAFLFLHRHEGGFYTDENSHDVGICYRVTVPHRRGIGDTTESSTPIFATAPCFCTCTARSEANGTMLLGLSKEGSTSLSSAPFGNSGSYFFRIEAICVPRPNPVS